MKKYELTDETKEYGSRTLYRIRAIRDFGDVKAGDIGGFVETEGNLSHDGNAWVYGSARVCSTRHYFVMGPAGSEDRYTTFYRGSDHAIHVRCGCFSGSLEDFRKKVSETHGGTKFEKEYMLAAELAETCIDLGGEND